MNTRLFGRGDALRKVSFASALLCGALALAACGVPRESAALARAAATPVEIPADAGEVRAALRQQAVSWARLESLLNRRELLGLRVDPRFVEAVSRTAALARRQEAILNEGADTDALNRQILAEFQAAWREADAYFRK